MGTSATPSSRPYTSTLRSEQAAATRMRVIDAAAELFSTHGFGRTTLAAIARAAGVSLETVQAQGSKRSLLTAAFRRGSYGLDTAERVLAAEDGAALLNAQTLPEFASAVAQLMTRENSSTPGIWRAFSSAAADDPKVDQEFAAVMAEAKSNVDEVVAMVHAKGMLSTDVSFDEVTATAWILISPETFEKLTVRLGWDLRRYQSWLTRSLIDLLQGSGAVGSRDSDSR